MPRPSCRPATISELPVYLFWCPPKYNTRWCAAYCRRRPARRWWTGGKVRMLLRSSSRRTSSSSLMCISLGLEAAVSTASSWRNFRSHSTWQLWDNWLLKKEKKDISTYKKSTNWKSIFKVGLSTYNGISFCTLLGTSTFWLACNMGNAGIFTIR